MAPDIPSKNFVFRFPKYQSLSWRGNIRNVYKIVWKIRKDIKLELVKMGEVLTSRGRKKCWKGTKRPELPRDRNL